MSVFSLIAACALSVTLPLFRYGPSCGHDFDFHLQSWFAANHAWHELTLYPRWLPEADYGAGEPRFVFYPPLSWMLGALLGAALPWTLVPQTLTLLALCACGLAFYALARCWVSRPVAAGAACLYLSNPYLLFVAYERTAYGELLCAATMPLVLLYTLSPRPAVVRLALVVAALWLTNAPGAVMGCYLLGLCALAAALSRRSILPAVQALIALALGTGLAGLYVLPAWYEQRWVEIARVVGPGMRVEDSFIFGHSGEPFHDRVLHTASTIGVAVLGAGLLCAVVSWAALRAGPGAGPGAGLGAKVELARGRARRGRPHLGLVCSVVSAALAAILLLLLPLSEPVWRFAPELHFLQFPWRWLLVGGLAAALAAAVAVESLGRLRRPGRIDSPALLQVSRRLPSIVMAAVLAAVLCAGAWSAGRYAQYNYAQNCDEEDNVLAQEGLLEPSATDADRSKPADAGSGFEGTDEYTPLGADNGEIQQGLPAVRLLLSPDADEGDDTAGPNPVWQPAGSRNGRICVEDWSPQYKRLTVTASGPVYAVLRLMDYPAWQVRVGGRVLAQRLHREDGLLTIPIPAGMTVVEIGYRVTPDVYAGRAVSLLSLGLLGLVAWSSRPAAARKPHWLTKRPRPGERVV